MKFVDFWIFLFALFKIEGNVESTSTSINVTVLYESLCPDSIRFVKKQLYPTYIQLKDYMNIEFVPFGKARFALNPWRISCQHGRHECTGNAVQACALEKYTENEMQVKFVHCVMSEYHPPAAGSMCANQLEYDYKGVEECARSQEGEILLARYGNRTKTYKKNLNFVPTIIFNHVYKEQDQIDALRNLKSVVCNKLEEPVPEPCKI